jgi:nucleosome binding factor SPN SPT16 subunit
VKKVHLESVKATLGFQDLVDEKIADPKNRNYALLLTDTVLVGKSQQGAAYLTDAPREFEKICFFFKDEEEEVKASVSAKPSPVKEVRATKSAVLKTKLRAEVRVCLWIVKSWSLMINGRMKMRRRQRRITDVHFCKNA